MAVVLMRNLSDARRLVAREWSAETTSGRVAVCCPDCGEIHELEDFMKPVQPSVKTPYIWPCPSAGCAFQEWLILESLWEPVV